MTGSYFSNSHKQIVLKITTPVPTWCFQFPHKMGLVTSSNSPTPLFKQPLELFVDINGKMDLEKLI